ncbi:AraC family transcriptional regulator [Propionibacteriaceae bacterium Y2011]|uniref:AraC family transcriptional regulator n=1 Tax=Microlunatus sp. Y2014 TaxID=3418488 RepID=UPI003B4F374E
MSSDFQREWLAGLARHGDRWASELFGEDRLDPSWSLDLRQGLPEHLVYLVVRGVTEGRLGSQQVTLRAGSLLWLPPRVPVRLRTVGQRGVHLYRFRLAAPADLTDTRPWSGPVRLLEDAWPLRETMDALVGELGGRLSLRGERVRALLVVLFSGIFRATGLPRGVSPLPPPVRAQLKAYADRRVAERPTAAELAGVVGLAPDYFTRRFRATFGLAPRGWLVRHRIHHAMQLLEETDDSITAVSTRLGYPDVFLFSRQFTAVVGTSPQTWRRGRLGLPDPEA